MKQKVKAINKLFGKSSYIKFALKVNVYIKLEPIIHDYIKLYKFIHSKAKNI